MTIKAIQKPDRKITQSTLYFQFLFMRWEPGSLEVQDDQFGTLPFGYVIAYLDSNIIGTLNLIERNISYADQRFSLGGFGGVCVNVHFRHQGIATKMIQEGCRVLKERNCEVVFIDSEPTEQELYIKNGFEKLKQDYLITGTSGKKYVMKNRGMVKNLASIEKFKIILDAEQIFDLGGQGW